MKPVSIRTVGVHLIKHQKTVVQIYYRYCVRENLHGLHYIISMQIGHQANLFPAWSSVHYGL
nr:MAG TPA: hypothetical protein [Crassvirales sp.]